MRQIKIKAGAVFFCVFMAWVMFFLFGAGMVWSQDTGQSTPFQELKKGDWWLVKVEQMGVWKRSAANAWVDAGEWKFEVDSIKEGKLYVKVTNLDRPEGAQPWELTLVYREDGEVIDAKYKVGGRTFIGDEALQIIPLGKEGLSIGKTIQRVKESPFTAMGVDVKTNQEVEMAKVGLADDSGYQLWRPREAWWRYYKKKKGLPVRAELKKTSWWEKEKE